MTTMLMLGARHVIEHPGRYAGKEKMPRIYAIRTSRPLRTDTIYPFDEQEVMT